MSKHIRPFKFKQFDVSHHRSSMKVGVDAVILGAWADISAAETILDVGCGCGVIALMCAQRNQNARIKAIDIHNDSVIETAENFSNSPWERRLDCENIDFGALSLIEKAKYDYIISNPPYFDSGIENPDSVREKARHQGNLSPEIILRNGKNMLSERGKIGMVIPIEQLDSIKTIAADLNMSIYRIMLMRGREGKELKRAFIEFCLNPLNNPQMSYICIETEEGNFTEEYRALCRDFYYKF